MKTFAMMTAALLIAGTAFAQKTITDADKTGVYMSATEVADAVAKLPKNPLASVPVFKIGPFNVNVEHRLGSPAYHGMHSRQQARPGRFTGLRPCPRAGQFRLAEYRSPAAAVRFTWKSGFT